MENVSIVAAPSTILMTGVNSQAAAKNAALLAHLNSANCTMRVGGITMSLRLNDVVALGLLDESFVGTANNFGELSDEAFNALSENAEKMDFKATVVSYDNRTIPVYGSETEVNEVVVYNVKVSISDGKEIEKQVKITDKLLAINLASNLAVGSICKFVVKTAKRGSGKTAEKAGLSSNIAWSALKLA